MTDLLALSARYIDEGLYEGPGSINRVTTELSEVAERIAVVESFSHVVAFRTDQGLVLFDASLEALAPGVIRSLRGWSDERVHTLVYTHGHLDHVGGAHVLREEARGRARPVPRVVAHENVPLRFARYELTSGYNAVINERQFGRGGRGRGRTEGMIAEPGRFGPTHWVHPDLIFRERTGLRVGDLEIELRHAKGETDDHLWAWIPERRAICAGDFVIWVFPNAGNPQKVQRYPLEWSRALREMAALEPELLLPAHGLPVAGRERIRTMLDDMASALETLVEQTLRMMNEGLRLDEILHAVRLPKVLLEKPYLRPTYDEPEFVIRNVWRLYGGWYDGNPAHLKPAPEAAFAGEVARLAGGARRLVERARALADAGDLRLACQIVELAAQAEPRSLDAHGARAEIYEARRKAELSLMARGIYGQAARESARVAGIEL
jgi:alkyl sulfatase BDS1-like metallo-beta-lactamase superfamily hydrolase